MISERIQITVLDNQLVSTITAAPMVPVEVLVLVAVKVPDVVKVTDEDVLKMVSQGLIFKRKQQLVI